MNEWMKCHKRYLLFTYGRFQIQYKKIESMKTKKKRIVPPTLLLLYSYNNNIVCVCVITDYTETAAIAVVG